MSKTTDYLVDRPPFPPYGPGPPYGPVDVPADRAGGPWDIDWPLPVGPDVPADWRPSQLTDVKPATGKPLGNQVGGDHYASMKIEPIDFIHANNLDFFQGNIIKYAVRHKKKNGVEDLKKIIHYAQMAIDKQYNTK